MKPITKIVYLARATLALACLTLPPQVGGVCLDGCDTFAANTFQGDQALATDGGSQNTAFGALALMSTTTALDNTATGYKALQSDITGGANTAYGAFALANNTTGGTNTGIGFDALEDNTTGANNTAEGWQSLTTTTTGSRNTACGSQAMFWNTDGTDNAAFGNGALMNNTLGRNNTACGATSLLSNTTGSENIALGSSAGYNLTTGSNNIDIGNAGVAGETGIVRIGTSEIQTATFIAGIRGVPITGAQPVGVNAAGQLGVRPSSARFKEAIKPMDRSSDAILALKPVTFLYKKELDPTGVPQYGLVAEEVAKINPDLVVTDEQGKPFTVRYEEINAMLLNEFLKEHRKVDKLEATVTELSAALKQQAAQIQKVSARLEVSSPRRGAQIVNND